MQSDDLAARGVRVKALEWEYRDRQSFGTYRSGNYWVNQSFGSDSYYFATVRNTDGAVLYDGDDLEAAKAAAQADYEARILAALEEAPITLRSRGDGPVLEVSDE